MKRWFFLLAFAFQPLWVLGQSTGFEGFLRRLNKLEEAGNFTRAKEYLLSRMDEFPDRWFYLSKELVHIHEKTGEYEKNLSLFDLGHRKGFFYFLHPALPRFKPYLEFPGFEDLTNADRKLYEDALSRSSTHYRVDLPADLRPGQTYPLFIIFHGGNSNLQKVTEHWHETFLESSYIRVYLQSYRYFDSDTYTWRSGDPRSDADLRDIFRELAGTYPVDTGRVVVAGISAGANYAIGMALRGVIPVTGFIAFCPGLPSELDSMMSPSVLRSDVRGYLVGGEFDFYRESQLRLLERFDGIELRYEYVLEKGMYHQYPRDEAGYIRKGLRFIFPERDNVNQRKL